MLPFVGRCLLFLGIVTSLTHAQAADNLRVPLAEEYLNAVPSIVAQIRDEAGNQNSPDVVALGTVIRDEIILRYGDLRDVSFDALYNFAPFFPRSVEYELLPETEWGWHNLLLDRWLIEDNVDLSAQNSWQIRDYALQVEQIDFTGDGIDELVVTLTFQPDDYPTFTEYFVLQRDDSRPSGYSRLGDTFFWYSLDCAAQAGCAGQAQLQPSQDLTGDGLPEWIISTGSCGRGICGVSLRIYGWHGGGFVDLTTQHHIGMLVGSGSGGAPAYPPNGEWEFENIDSDQAIEIKQIEHITDNRGCEFSSEQVFDWDIHEGQFQSGVKVYEYADTSWCALRQAHLAMIDLDFENVIRQYEYFLSFEPELELVDVWQYARLRLAFAYAEVGRSDEAEALLDDMQIDTISDDMIHSMAAAAKAAWAEYHNAKRLCAALYSSLEAYSPYALADSLLFRYGQNNDYGVALNYGGGDYSPSRTGCNIRGLWESTVENLDLEIPLMTQLEAAGWEVAEELTSDLNGDGIEERLIIPRAINLGVLMWSRGNITEIQIVFSRYSPSVTSEVAIVSLPDVGDGIAQINTYPTDRICPSDSVMPSSWIEVWWLSTEGLQQAAYTSICDPQSIAETFPVVGEMRLLKTLNGEADVLYWDSNQLKFVSPSAESTTSYNAGINDPLSCHTGIYGFCGDLENPLEALRMIDLVLDTSPEDASPYFVSAFRYYRALVLEALDRPQEALEDYIAIYAVNPESPWARLAALHFE